MAEMAGFLWPLLVLWVLFVGATSKLITKRIGEELEVGTLVADLKKDSHLDAQFNQSTMSTLRFSFLTSLTDDNQQYFDLDPASGLIRTSVRIDRDRICPSAVTCTLPLDVAIQPPHFRVVKLAIELLDENDNAPRFPSPVVRTSVFESTHPGPFFPIQLAEDPDSPPNSIVRYTIHPSSDQFDLMVSRSEGAIQDVQLVLKETLDRERKDSYQIKIYAFDGGQPPKSGSVTVDVIVTDVNDHRPEFERSSYEIEIVENSPPKRLLAVKATDADSGLNGAIRYKFSPKSQSIYGTLFSIDPETGQISLLKSLDYEQHSLITLEVLAQDQGPGSAPVMTRVVVNVRDVNDNEPEIRFDQSAVEETLEEDGKQYVHLTEHCANNTYVVQLTVRDPDEGGAGEVQCFLHQANRAKPDHFQLVEVYDKEFSLMTTATIDRELTDRYELTVTCRDNGRPQLTSVQQLVIVVDDLNDNSPQFTQHNYDVSVKENIGPLEVFLQVTATDTDAKENGTVTYSIRTTDPPTMDIFKIDRNSGSIWTTSSLDRETREHFQFHVVASDGLPGQNSSRSSTALVNLYVLDVNDEVPRFLQQRYNFTVYENQSPKTNVGQVTAFDPDLSPGNRFTYHLDPTTCPTNLFRIDSMTGMIRTLASLNREEKESYEFKVMARDELLPGSPPESATVAVYVRDENDNAPTIYFPGAGNDTVYIPNTVPVGHLVTSVIARDPDEGDNARLTYVISGGNERGVFGIDPLTGELFVNSVLSDYEMDTFRLKLIVKDGGAEPKERSATLQVVVSAASHLQAASGQPISNFRLSFSDTHLAVIVGIIGGCLVIALALALAVCCVRRRRRHDNAAKGRVGEGGTGNGGSQGALTGVKYAPAGSNGGADDHCSLGTGSGPSYMRDSIGLPEDLGPDDGYVIVNCTHPGDSVTTQMVYDRRSRLYSPKPEMGKCQQCDEAMNQLHMSCSRAPAPALTSADYARYPQTHHRPIYTPIDYNQVMLSEAAGVLPISSPDWTTSASPHQRKPSFSQWLNSESFQLRQKGQAYNIADYGTLTRANGHARPANGDIGGGGVTTLLDPQRNVMATSLDGTIRAPSVVTGPRPLGLMGRLHVTSPPCHVSSAGQMFANDAAEGRNHVTSIANVHPLA